MKQFYILLPIIVTLSCSDEDFSTTQGDCNIITNNSYGRADALQKIIDRYTAEGVTGVSVGVQQGASRWEGASGFASIEENVAMKACHLMYSQSLAKTYTAVTIFQLNEQGRIDLDQKIGNYLPAQIADHITNSEEITVRMLLNHTSGIYDYAYSYAYATYLLNNGDRVFSKETLLDFILDKKAKFKPGERYGYCNTNYFLLAYMVEHITGKSHAQVIRKGILEPLGLEHTFYREEIANVIESGLVNCYIDRLSDGVVENVSKQQINNVLSMMGDDSIVATPSDYVDFLKGLLSGKLISQASLDQMMTWVQDRKGNPAYGQGLDYAKFDDKWIAYGHSGGGLGAGCVLYYFPEQDVTLFVGVNLSTLLGGPLVDKVDNMRKELFEAVLAD
ncbi:MAG: serine hydrolase domain-containing protein [Cyclobacteriaceae bacterium]